MLGSLYVALKSAGVDEAPACEAAEEIAEYLRPRAVVTWPSTLLYLMLAAQVVLTVVVYWQLFTSG